ncbi:MAG: hypothetical protein IT158_30480 [Bryobacterales bacterium]|nr:hypothetical protein [Bryobacterales bacterium]
MRIPWMAAALALLAGCLAGKNVVTWPAPEGERLSADYTLRVNGLPAAVYSCRVSAMPFNQVWPGYQRPLDQTELAGFAYWSMSGPVTVEVHSRRPFQSVAVRPLSRGIRWQVKGRRIRFRLDRPGPVTVELDGPRNALHLFADPPESEVPKAGDPDVLYFGPGVHRPGKIQLRSGQTVYVAGGAVVYTAIDGRGVSNVRILGRGVIDTSEFERGQGGGSIRLSGSTGVKIEGVILRDPDVWCLSAFGCRNLDISRVKLIGLWRYNADGIDICNSQDVTIRDSFVRSFDDAVVLKGLKSRQQSFDARPVRNVLAAGLVIWCDWGRALEIGAETSAPEISEVAFRDIDVIRNTHIAMDIQHGDRAAVRGIRFEDIRVEVDDSNPQPLLQKEPGETYRPRPEANYLPQLMVIVIRRNRYSADTERGTVRDVLFRNIAVTGSRLPPSSFTGLDAQHDVRGVTIQNLRFNGRPVTGAEAAGLRLGTFVEAVRFVENEL